MIEGIMRYTYLIKYTDLYQLWMWNVDLQN